MRGPFEAQSTGAGTGVVIDDKGHILTNAHVVEGATSITVSVGDDSAPRRAILVASDASTDIALLRVDDTAGLAAADVASPGTTEVGDAVVAIGNALALEGGVTVTQGIVSAPYRSIDTDSGTLVDLIQTDAAISSRNSGGPLVDARGEVVAINPAVASSASAISIDKVLAVAAALLGRSL